MRKILTSNRSSMFPIALLAVEIGVQAVSAELSRYAVISMNSPYQHIYIYIYDRMGILSVTFCTTVAEHIDHDAIQTKKSHQ